MTIEALKYKTKDKDEIIVCVTLHVEYSDGISWSIRDIKYRPYRKKKYISMEDKFRDEARYIANPTFERKNKYIKDKLIEFIGEDVAKKAYIAAWESIKPNVERLIEGD